MIWNNPAPLGRTWRRNAVTSAVLYGLSLSVRFTSATGEEIEVPMQTVERSHGMLSILNSGEHASENDWSGRTAVPLAFHRGSPKLTAGATPSSSSNCFPP
jgi:hypothetical protein